MKRGNFKIPQFQLSLGKYLYICLKLYIDVLGSQINYNKNSWYKGFFRTNDEKGIISMALQLYKTPEGYHIYTNKRIEDTIFFPID